MAAVAASLIPERHNYPGICGRYWVRDTLRVLRTPAETYGVSIGHRRVYQLNLTSYSFGATAGGVEMQARRALLATCGRVLEIVIRWCAQLIPGEENAKRNS